MGRVLAASLFERLAGHYPLVNRVVHCFVVPPLTRENTPDVCLSPLETIVYAALTWPFPCNYLKLTSVRAVFCSVEKNYSK